MTSYERLLTAATGGVPDRTPVAPEVFGVAGRLNGHTIYEYIHNSRVLSESQLRLRAAAGYDIVFAFSDLSVEAEALGCELDFHDDSYPAIKNPILKDLRDIKTIQLPVPGVAGRMPVVLDAARHLRESLGNDCLVAACVMGPVSLASQLMGLENFMYLLADNPKGVEKVLDLATGVASVYGKALLKAGAHCIVVFDPAASPVVFPPPFFLKYEVPRLKKLFKTFKAAGSLISWISIAGAIHRIMPFFIKTGINIATIDYVVDVSDAYNLVKDLIALNGNIKPYSFIVDPPDLIKDSVKANLLATSGRGNYIVGSGCEVPVESAYENICALVEAVRER
ncbi:MAG: uroporphyrinogen decarboxylase family protein [Dissulfurispiraceae bacterium]|jgi:uroporphyrinogen decarboxylase|nr:uroporphyrinogen decarboxylase family protein [Dissulfurispiraceae bacterium]